MRMNRFCTFVRPHTLLLAGLLVATLLTAIAPGAKPPPASSVPFHYHVQYLLLPGETSSSANGLNDWGDVVGGSGGRPFFYDSSAGTVTDLTTVLDPMLGVFIDEVQSVNNARQIAGRGHDANGRVI